MSEEKSNTLPTALAGMAKAIIGAASGVRAGGNDLFCKFAKGEWSFGQDGTVPEADSIWAVNPTSFKLGFQAWGADNTPQAGTLLGERMLPITTPVNTADLPDVGGKWQAAVELQLRCTNGEDEGVQVLWGSCSRGGVDAFQKQLLVPIGQKLAAGDEACVPLVKLERDSYQHSNKAYGKIWTPLFEIVGWQTLEGGEAEAEPEKLEEAPAEVPEVAPEGEKKKRRRRSRAA